MLFGFPLAQADFLSAIVVLGLALLAHLPLGIFSASFLLIFKRGDPITSLVGHLSALLAGVYFPLSVLPGWLQTVSFFLPFTHALEGLRQAVLNSWPIPPIFKFLQELGSIPLAEMLRTFNYGIGLVLVVPPEQENDVLLRLQGLQEEAYVIGEVSERKNDAPPVTFV